MVNKAKKYLKIVLTIAIPCLFIWFLIINPLLDFKGYEADFEEAAKRYYQLNPDKLPTGKRVSEVSLKMLYNDAYVKEDFYVPYTKKPCSITESWVKVRQKEAGEYEYITFLQCGIFKSSTDHEGPVIKLNGAEEITVDRGVEYKDPGIESVKDNKDGKIDINDVVVDTSKVDTKVNGTYEVTYTVLDSLKNKTTIKRKVTVVQKLKNTVAEATHDTGIYQGEKVDNYIRFSGMMFRIVGLDGNNVKIVAEKDIANVNHKGIDKWLDYFYDHLAASSKKYIIKNKYCTGEVSSDVVNEKKECVKKTDNRNVYLLSNKEINESRNEAGTSYLLTWTMSWTANTAKTGFAWAFKNAFLSIGSQYMGFSDEYNFGIRPLLTIKGDALIKSGDGTYDNPYSIDDIKKGTADEYLNTRYSGEYITYSGYLWRIIEVADDETTKVVADKAISISTDGDTIGYETEDDIKIYNPKQKGNIGYKINQKAGDSVNEAYFISKEITVPIYETVAKYGEEKDNKKYKVKFSAPNMYDMFSASQYENGRGYWLLNSSKQVYRKYMVSNIGVVMYEQLADSTENYVRPVGYLDKRIKIVSGSGTKNDPYKISK